jgi:hypothetical protein
MVFDPGGGATKATGVYCQFTESGQFSKRLTVIPKGR